MKPLLFIISLAIPLVTGCASKDIRPEIDSALNSQPDGYKGIFGNPSRDFEISRTYASDTELCRVVVLSGPPQAKVPTTSIESFCKAKGGKWR